MNIVFMARKLEMIAKNQRISFHLEKFRPTFTSIGGRHENNSVDL